MARPHVPQFGKWESDGNNIPYTVVFDKAREGRGGKMINPNDPRENPAAFGSRAPPAKPHPKQAEPVRRGPTQGNGGRRGDGAGERNRRPSRTSIGSEHSIDRSPLHQYQPKVTGRGTGSTPAFETKGSTNVNRTPGRPRQRSFDDDLDKGVTVPPFGSWDEKNPNAGAGLTTIFDNLSHEKRTGTPNITTETHDYARSTPKNAHKKANKSKCFPWF